MTAQTTLLRQEFHFFQQLALFPTCIHAVTGRATLETFADLPRLIQWIE
jgi:hypothetical protein